MTGNVIILSNGYQALFASLVYAVRMRFLMRMGGLTWLVLSLWLLVACDGPPDPQVIATYPMGAGQWTAHESLSPCPRQPSTLPPAMSGGWNPADTFREAFVVFMGIFQVLADILIWSIVVAGPFALLALGIRSLIQRLRRRAGAQE